MSLIHQVQPKPSCKVSEWGKKTRQTQKEGSGEQRKMEGTGCEIICGAQTTPASKGQVKVKKGIECSSVI